MQSRQLYQFGAFQLDPAEHLLLRRGERVPLTPKTFDLLVYLVENRGRLVTKNQILEAVWPDSFVEEANLTVSVSALRKALGERRGESQFIDTIPKKGYRFIASVTEVQPTSPAVGEALAKGPAVSDWIESETKSPSDSDLELQEEPGRDNYAGTAIDVPDAESSPSVETGLPIGLRSGRSQARWWLTVALLSGLLAGAAIVIWRWKAPREPDTHPRRLAVLPFQNLNHDPASDFLGFPLADAIINRLGYVSQLTIRPSYAVERYRSEIPDVQQVATALAVDTLLTGSFIREGDDLRVSYQLIDVRSDRILRKGTINLKYQNLLAVQDDVAEQVISGLALTLPPLEEQRLKDQQPIDALAYEYYLRGVDLYSRNDFPTAIKMLERSAEIYPNYAWTWAHLGRAYTASASFQFGGVELYQKARAAYQKALALQPTLALVRIYMANLLTDTGRPEDAVPLLQQTLAANAKLAEAHWELGYAYRFAGMQEDSVRECLRARELDPVVKLTSSVMNGYLYLGRYEAFLRSLPEIHDSAFIEFYRGFALYHMQQWDRAAEALDHAYELEPQMLQAEVGRALSYGIRQQKEKGLALLHDTEDKISERGVGDPEALYKVAEAYAELGDTASALRTFRHSIENGFFPYPYFVRDPLLKNLRQEAGFEAALQPAKQRHEAFQRKFFAASGS